MTSTSLVARLLLRIGLALLSMSILCRLVGPGAPDQVGADLAIGASLLLVLVAAATLRLRRDRGLTPLTVASGPGGDRVRPGRDGGQHV